MPKAKSNHFIYQLYIQLVGSEPSIWRRFTVSGLTKLYELHDIIQIVMGWENDHLYEFTIGGQSYGREFSEDPRGFVIVGGNEVIEEDDEDDEENEDVEEDEDDEEPMLQELVSRKGMKFAYLYDFGDSWEHRITVEERTPCTSDSVFPCCLDGARACPPEDSGGIYQFGVILKILQKQKNKKKLTADEADMLEWVGDEFDPDEFSIEDINQVLKEYFQLDQQQIQARIQIMQQTAIIQKEEKEIYEKIMGEEGKTIPLPIEMFLEILETPIRQSEIPEVQQKFKKLKSEGLSTMIAEQRIDKCIMQLVMDKKFQELPTRLQLQEALDKI